MIHRYLLPLVATGVICLLPGRADEPAPAHQDKKSPVENPEDKKGPSQAMGDGVAHGDWSMQPAWHKGSNLTQIGYLLNPAGETLGCNGRVLALCAVHDGKFLVAKTDRGAVLVEAAGFKVLQQLDFPGKGDGGTMHGIAVGPDGSTVWLSSRKSKLCELKVSVEGSMGFGREIDLSMNGKASDPLGIAIGADGKRAFVALAIRNSIAEVDLEAGKMLRQFPAGVCPYGVILSADGTRVFTSNFGGSHAKPGEMTELSAGTPVAVDPRSVALRGSVSVIDVAAGTVVKEIPTRIHPEAMVMAADGRHLFVVDASGDGVSEIAVGEAVVTRQFNVKPRADLPFGSLATGIAASADGKWLFTANAGNNAVAMLPLDRAVEAPEAFIPAGGYPGSLCLIGKDLVIGNVLGFKGDIQKVSLPGDKAARDAMTAVAEKSYHLAEILRAAERAEAGSKGALKPVPARLGEPSPIKHVVYIIKENKKFDQVFGAIGRGNADPKLCEFPRATTPNIHALADRFVLLDNYYCNGVLSCDGHQHATQGHSSPYREKDWANARCTYDFGIDPLCYTGCGFIWDQVLRHGLAFQNFGELDYTVIPKGMAWKDYHAAWKNGGTGEFKTEYKIDALRRYSHPGYPGWAMAIPDQIRADIFLKALAGYSKAGKMPDFVVIYLPNDHTQGASKGWPTPRAYVADNDLATGRIVEGLSHSPFWKDMAVFINEDDPQTGADHVDGHRSYCLVAGPYVKRGGQVISRFYNQSSVLHTISRIFGLPPLNQTVAAAPLMDECFTDKPDFTPFTALPNTVPLDEVNGAPTAATSKTAADLGPLTEKLDFTGPDRIDKDAVMFSRWVWATIHGDRPFPVEFTGAHGKGLAALGLQIDKARADEDEDDDDDET